MYVVQKFKDIITRFKNIKNNLMNVIFNMVLIDSS